LRSELAIWTQQPRPQSQHQESQPKPKEPTFANRGIKPTPDAPKVQTKRQKKTSNNQCLQRFRLANKLQTT